MISLLQSKKSPFSSVQSLNHVWLFATPWIAACQASLSITQSPQTWTFCSASDLHSHCTRLAKNILISPAKRHTHLKVSSGHTSQRDFPFFPAHPSVGLLQPSRGPFISHYQCSLDVELQYFGAKDQILTECFQPLPVTNMQLIPMQLSNKCW